LKNEDLIRELEKVEGVFEKVTKYLQIQSEANAGLHMSDKVMYPPLTSATALANQALHDLIERLKEYSE